MTPWSAAYVDAVVERDRNGDNDSSTGNRGKSGSGLEQRTYALQDANWNTTASIATDGTVIERYQYDPYGAPTMLWSDWSQSIELPGVLSGGWTYLFQGGRYDPATGLVDRRGRAYSTSLGRWIQQDPSGYTDSVNLYEFITSNPISLLDPSGLSAEDEESDGSSNDVDLFQQAQNEVNAADDEWLFDSEGMSLADSAFSLADMHEEELTSQVGAINTFVHEGFQKIVAAQRFDLAMADFLRDYVYINPETLPLGFFGARACFVAGTQVVVGTNKDGSDITRNIEDLRPGDTVLSRDQNDAADDVQPHKVVRVFRKVSDHLRILKIQGKDGNVETIRTTDTHPFWAKHIGWVCASDLHVGSEVDELDGSFGTVISTSREAHPDGIVVYNFEVEGDHTYFVEENVGEDTPIWVHNACAWKLRANLEAAGSALVRASKYMKYGVEQGVEVAAHLVPRGAFSNRAADVVEAIERAKGALAAAAIDINDAANGFLTDAANQLGTHTDAFFRRMGKVFEQFGDDAAGALAQLLKEVKAGKFVKP
jgi:RHS repeat-associated protein